MKTLSLSFLCLMMSLSASAQLNIEQLVFGPKAGINLANVVAPEGDDISARPLYFIGVFGDATFTEQLGGRVELVFSHQGGREDNDFTGELININLTYLNLPILITYSPIPELQAFAGPQIGILLGANGVVKEGRFEGKFDVKDRQTTVDIAFVFGASYEVIENLRADLRFNLGLINIEKEGRSFFNRVIQIGASYDLVKK